jgi:hypothetical protein
MSYTFCRSACFVLPSWHERNANVSGLLQPDILWSYQTQILETFPVKEVFDDVEGNDELEVAFVNDGIGNY